MKQKKVAPDLTFRPSEAFASAIGFFVRASIESLDGGDSSIIIGHAWEPDGYEVVFTGPRKALIELLGQEIDIPGHAILAYSGEMGPWRNARIRNGEVEP